MGMLIANYILEQKKKKAKKKEARKPTPTKKK